MTYVVVSGGNCTASPICPRADFHHHPVCHCGSVDFSDPGCETCRTLRVIVRQRDAAAWDQVNREARA